MLIITDNIISFFHCRIIANDMYPASCNNIPDEGGTGHKRKRVRASLGQARAERSFISI
jgi:hypothetical protein